MPVPSVPLASWVPLETPEAWAAGGVGDDEHFNPGVFQPLSSRYSGEQIKLSGKY